MTDTRIVAAAAGAGLAAGAAVFALAQRAAAKSGHILASTAAPARAPFTPSDELAACDSMLASGTLLICTQNLAVSGANQVALNIAEGHIWRGKVVVLSPSSGPFAKEFADLGVAVWIGELDMLLRRVPDVRVAICNTIMTAHIVNALTEKKIPAMWILHEWWPNEMLVSELTKRNDRNTTPDVVRLALATCPRTVCVCKAQRDLYKPAHGVVTFVGVPEPAADWKISATPLPATTAKVTFLCLGIVCPRKNQHWAVEAFKQWAKGRQDVRLLVVGARYIRQYEIDYVDKVKATIGGDPRIELHDVTNDVDQYYRQSDVLLFTSLNEVTPMVIAEAMMRSLPVITTDIAGIPEMLEHGVHGYAHPPDNLDPFVDALDSLGATDADGQRRRLQMGAAARKHALETFTNAHMVAQYRGAALQLSPPVVLVDMDGCLVDWDAGFEAAWGGRSPIIRALSYSMEECVPPDMKEQARALFHAPGFFLGLPPMAGGVAALHALDAKGYKVMLCTSPVTTSAHCAGEKFEWVRKHLGASWVPRIIITSDKTAVRGDVLIDDKPSIAGHFSPVWQQLLFDAPYNLKLENRVRLSKWDVDGVTTAIDVLMGDGPPPESSAAAAAAPADNSVAGAVGVNARAVAALPDFAHLLPADYRKDYMAWRSGGEKGARGELSDAMNRFEAMQDSVLNNTADEFTEVHIFRRGYASWRKGRGGGASSKSFGAIGTISLL